MKRKNFPIPEALPEQPKTDQPEEVKPVVKPEIAKPEVTQPQKKTIVDEIK